jgi:hypothetical protein
MTVAKARKWKARKYDPNALIRADVGLARRLSRSRPWEAESESFKAGGEAFQRGSQGGRRKLL